MPRPSISCIFLCNNTVTSNTFAGKNFSATYPGDKVIVTRMRKTISFPQPLRNSLKLSDLPATTRYSTTIWHWHFLSRGTTATYLPCAGSGRK